jgi:chromosomal replication initiation ATPase DnaA
MHRGERQAFDQRILGSGNFVETVLKKADQMQQESGPFRPLNFSDVIQAVARVMEIDPSRLTEKGRSRSVAQGKALVIYAAVKWLGRSLKEVGQCVGIASGAASRAFERGRLLAEKVRLMDLLKQFGSYVP